MKKNALLVVVLFAAFLTMCRADTAPRPSGTQTRDTDGMVMVQVPAGQFTMGSQESDIERAVQVCSEYRGACTTDLFADEAPAHLVTVAAFWIDRTEVTNAQYRRCIAAGACTATSCPDDAALSGDNQPVVCVSWEQAGSYCAWAGGRLPTEAEWEYAARGPQDLPYPWGADFVPTNASFCDAHCPFSWADMEANDGYTTTAPVGSFPGGASWCGALDLAGNAWEWVQDWYTPYTADPQTNPVIDEGSRGRVLRGGAWDLDPAFLRATTRNWGSTTASSNVSGFRCVVPSSGK